MTNLLDAALRAALAVSLSLSPVILLLLLLRPALHRRFQAKWAYWAWLAMAVRLALPVPLSLPHVPTAELSAPQAVLYRQEATSSAPVGSGYTVRTPGALAMEQTQAVASAQGRSGAAAQHTDAVPRYAAVISLSRLAVLIWAAGCAGFLLWQIFMHLRFVHKIRRWREAPEPGLPERFEALRAGAGVRRISLARCPAISSPMVTGLFRPVLLLPRIDYPPAELEAVLRHELVHAGRHDLWYKLLLLLARAVHWFNPLVHCMARTAAWDLEISCDEAVVAGQGAAFRARYGGAVLSAAAAAGEGAPLTTYFKGSKRAMKERLRVIASPGGRRRGIALGCAAALLVLAAGGACVLRRATATALPDTFSGYTLEVPYGVAVEQTEVFPEGTHVSSMDAVLSRDGGEVGSARILPRSRAVPEQAPPYVSPGGIPGWRFEDGKRETFALSMTQDTVLCLAFSNGGEAPLTGEERAALLSSVRLGFAGADSPDGGYSLTSYPGGEGEMLWYLWDCRGGAPALLDTAAVRSTALSAAPQWAPDGSYAVVPGRGERFMMLMLTKGDPKQSRYDGLDPMPSLFDSLKDPMDAFTQSFAARETELPPDYRSGGGSDLALALPAHPFSEASGAELYGFRFAYAFTGPTGELQSGRADYFPQAHFLSGLHPVTQAVQSIAPNPPAVRRACAPDAAHGVPGWSAPLPEDLGVVSAEGRSVDPALPLDGSCHSGALLLTRGTGEDALAVGVVEYVPLNAAQRAGTEGLLAYRGNVAHYHIPDGDTGRAFRLSLRMDVFDQVLTDKIAEAFLIGDSTPTLPGTRLGEALWRAELDGYALSLRPMDGAEPWFVLERGETLRPFLNLCGAAGVDSYEDYAFPGTITAHPFTNVLGHDGFVLSYGVGALSRPIEYYCLDEWGAPVLLASCNITALELDWNGDGTSELLTYYHNMGFTYVYALVDGRVLEADVCADADRLLDLPAGTAGLQYLAPEGTYSPGDPLGFRAYSTRQEITLPEDTRLTLSFSDLTFPLAPDAPA